MNVAQDSPMTLESPMSVECSTGDRGRSARGGRGVITLCNTRALFCSTGDRDCIMQSRFRVAQKTADGVPERGKGG